MKIKFRVRNKETKVIIGYEWIDNLGNWKHQHIGDEAIFNNVFDINGTEFIREQYVGINDINNKEIYKGDVLHVGDKNILYVVEWIDTGFKGRQMNNKSCIGIIYWQKYIELLDNFENLKSKGDL